MLVLVRNGTESTPGIFGTNGRAPTLRKMLRASSKSSPTRNVFGPSNTA